MKKPEFPHPSHAMRYPNMEHGRNNECTTCGHKMWGAKNDWCNDTQLGVKCTGKRAAMSQQVAK